MKRLLRGVIDFGALSQEGMSSNLCKLQRAGIDWLQPADRAIYQFVCDFTARHHVAPPGALVTEFFDKIYDIDATERLKEIQAATPYEDANYTWVLTNVVEDGRKARLLSALKQAQEIAQKGQTVGDGKHKQRLEGVDAALSYLGEAIYDLRLDLPGQREEGDALSAHDVADAKANYESWEQETPIGVPTGLQPMDALTGGLQAGRLWLHAAFTGGLKSTFAMNWSWRAVTRYRRNVVFYSLEMGYDEIQHAFYCLHAAHPKWGRPALSLQQIRRGKLSAEDKAHYFAVLDNIGSEPGYGHLHLRTPSKGVSLRDIRGDAERLHRSGEGIDMIVVDHSILVTPPDPKERDATERFNATFREAKRLAQGFAEGKGTGVLLLHQINREGAKRTATGGNLQLSDLARANEAERSADVVTATWTDESLRSSDLTRFIHLKNRSGPLADPFLVDVHPHSRLMSFDPDAPPQIDTLKEV